MWYGSERQGKVKPDGEVFFAVAGNRAVFREQALALACAWGDVTTEEGVLVDAGSGHSGGDR